VSLARDSQDRVVRNVRELLEYEGLRVGAWFVRSLPHRALLPLARVLGNLVYLFDARGRRVSIANLTAALGDDLTPARRRHVARMSYGNFARVMLELFWSPNLTRDNFSEFVEVEMPEMPGGPAVVFCLHFGNFEWLSLIGAWAIEPGPVVMQQFRNSLLTPFFSGLRASSGNDAISQRRAMLKLLKVLKGGGKCGVLTDLTLDPKEGAVLIECFGLKTAVTPIVAVLAQRTGAPVVASEALPLPDGRWRLRYLPPVRFEPSVSAPEIVQACWNVLEPSIRAHPELWIWSYKHWRFKPREGGERYPFYANAAKRFDELVRTTVRAGT